MKRIIRFDRAFVPAIALSLTLIAAGMAGYFMMGFNLGVDFQAGINQYVQLAYPALEVSYTGKGNAVLSISEKGNAAIVFSGAEVEARTVDFDIRTGTIGDFAAKVDAIENVDVKVLDGGTLPAALVVPTYQGDFNLATGTVLIHRTPRDDNELFAPIDRVRAAAGTVGTVSVQSIGDKAKQQFIIRVQDDKKDADFGVNASVKIRQALESAFGAGKVVVMKTDTVDQRFSKDLSKNALWLVLATLGVIMIYSTLRFKLQYAIGAVLAIAHDALIMIGFIVWTRMEFNTSSIAAILTILGYSINDTIVIFDRVREDRRLAPNESFTNIMNKSITETMSRTIITILTTMLAVLALFIFTTGSIKDFSLALLVGLVSGTYSTVFIATAFAKFWDDVSVKRMEKKAIVRHDAHHPPKKEAKAALQPAK
ncbi:MAG: protein translocase subunit SecF [Spirochaetes bacterium]|nr:protein translocase subunit SecF [Spirochaetota bacterium]